MKIDARDHLKFLVKNIDHLASNLQPSWHPLGFVSCVIQKTIDLTLRVHYWPENERRTKNPDWPIHTHSYTLSSLVLSGQIEDIQYITAEGDEYIIYQVAYTQENSEIIKTNGSLNISSAITVKQFAGEQYRVEKRVFHQSRVDFDRSAVTLVALSEFSNEPPLVLGKPGQMRYPYDRIPFDREIFWSAIRNSLER